MATVSVIIPCYNTARYINKCINALEKQLFKDFEIIIIDDCSTDDTVDVIERIKKGTELSINFIRNTENSGPAVSRNKGIIAATSEYITFCDSDDWYEPDFLSIMYEAITRKNANIVFCGYNVVDENGNIQKRPLVSKDINLSKIEALSLEADSLCMLMVKTSMMKETLLPNIRNGEDVAVVPLLIAKSEQCAVLRECLYNYFRRQGSASQKPTMKVVNSLIASFTYTKQHFPQNMNVELEYLGIKNMLYSTLISLFSFSYDTQNAKEILDAFEKDFPDWNSNPYFSHLTSHKRIVLKFAKYRWFFAIKMISYIRTIIIR